MILTEFQGSPVWFLDDSPSWRDRFSVRLELLASSVQSLSGLEERTPLSKAAHLTLQFKATATGPNLLRLDRSLREYRDERVFVPFWPGACRWDQRKTMPFVAGLYVVIGGLKFNFYEAASLPPDNPGPGDVKPNPSDLIVPVVVCYFIKRAVMRRHADIGTVTFELVESGPAKWSLTGISSQPFVHGPMPGTGWISPPYLLPWRAMAGDIAETIDVTIERETIGLGHDHVGTDYKAPAETDSDISTYLDTPDAGPLFAWFAQHAAGTPFWMPTWSNAARVTKRSAFVEGEIDVVSSAGVRVGDWLTMIDSAWFARVTAIRPGVLVVNGSTRPVYDAFSMAPATLLLAPLRLVKFTRPSLSLTWLKRSCLEVSLPVREVSTEYDIAAGSRVGVVTTQAWLFEFTSAGVILEQLTSHESDVTYNSVPYFARRLEHGSISHSTSLDRDELEFKAAIGDCTTLRDMISLQNEAPVYLRVSQVAVDNSGVGTEARTLFFGEITKPKLRGMVVSCRAIPGGTILDRMVPRFVIKPDCNHDLYSPGCSVNRAGWEFTAVITNVGVPGYPYDFALGSLTRLQGTMPSIFRGWFAGGMIAMDRRPGEKLGQRRAILDSTQAAGNALTITLSGDPNPYPVVGEVIHLWPGCDGRRETCLAPSADNLSGKFANYPNFGGHPFVPLANPTLVKLNAGHSGGKK